MLSSRSSCGVTVISTGHSVPFRPGCQGCLCFSSAHIATCAPVHLTAGWRGAKLSDWSGPEGSNPSYLSRRLGSKEFPSPALVIPLVAALGSSSPFGDFRFVPSTLAPAWIDASRDLWQQRRQCVTGWPQPAGQVL